MRYAAKVMVVLGALLGMTLAVLAALLMAAVVATLWFGSNAVALGLSVAALLCLVLPLILDWRVTRAFRRVQPDAKGTFFQTLAIVNIAWLLALVLLFPQRTRASLEQQGTRLVPGLSQRQVDRAATLIPRSAATPPERPAASASANISPTPPPSESSSSSASTLPAPNPVSSGIRAPADVDAESETPAGKVYRERVGSVVVLHVRSALPDDGMLRQLYEKLGLAYGESLGSGFVVDPTGLIVTNYHVVEGASSLQVVTQDGSHFEEVTLLREEPKHDLALISVSAKGLAAAPLSRAKDVAVGARAIAIGSPLGFEYTLTEGIVSQLRNVDGTRFLQMQTAIAPGSSGGPLFDHKGSVIGVNTATGGAAGLSLAVHYSEVAKLLAAPRKPKVLERFVPGPRLASLEAEGGDLSPTDRLNLKEGTSLLGHAAMRCAKPLTSDARVVVKLAGVMGEPQIESNLSAEARECLSMPVRLIGMQVGMAFAQSAQRPRALLLTFVDIPTDGGATGSLMYRFEVGGS